MTATGYSPAVIAGALRTYALGGLGGVVFYALNLPAPFMLGSVLFCWVIGGLFKPISRRLDLQVELLGAAAERRSAAGRRLAGPRGSERLSEVRRRSTK